MPTMLSASNGGNITLRISARQATGGHASGSIAIQYDCTQFPSALTVNTNKGARNFFLHTSNTMDLSDNAGDSTIDTSSAVTVNAGGGNTWKVFGTTWTGLVK